MPNFPKSNFSLKKAISKFNKKKTQEHRNEVFNALKSGPLLVAVDSIPQSYLSNTTSVDKHVINMLSIRTQNGSFRLAVFTDEKEVAEYEPGPYMSMEPQGLLEIVQQQLNDGIMINPAGQRFYISLNRVKKILQNWEKE